MSDIAIRMDHVYKKFRKGEVYNSLRDLIPALTGKMFRQQDLNAKDKREFWAVQDLSFEVKYGECMGIIGRNGAGKSTALKILSRIMKPTRGSMEVNGRLSSLIEVTAGLHPDLSGRENIFLNGTILGMSKREIDAKLDQIIAFSGIEEFIDTPVKRYSSGMHARLGFSVAAHVDPDVLIVDEVLSVGDYAFQQKCIERMREVLRAGTAVLFVSHNLKTVGEFCDRCLLLEKGETVSIGTPKDVIGVYLQRPSAERKRSAEEAPVRITSARVRDEHGECSLFDAGQKAWFDIDVTAASACSKLSATLYILDDKGVEVFDTSTDLLGFPDFDLEEGDSYRCTFELSLNFVDGTYYPCVLIYRRDIQTIYDKWEPVTTLCISSGGGVHGVVHCFPRVIQHDVTRQLDAVPVGTTGDTVL